MAKGKPDRDVKDKFCMTYDVVFHDDVRKFIVREDFKKFVADTAVDGVNKVLAEHKEKVSTDYKILKNVFCKGERPQLMTIKLKDANPLIGSMDINKAETKLQKDIMKQRQEQLDKEKAEKAAKEKVDGGQEEVDEESAEEEEQRPTGIVQPKYKVVHTFRTDMMDAWEGHKGTVEEGML